MLFDQSRIVRSFSPAYPQRRKAMVEMLETRRMLSSYSIAELTLGGDYSEVLALNEAGQVAGYSNTADNSAAHAYLYTDANDNGLIDAGEIADLGTLGGTFSQASLLNEAGQAAGYSFTGGNAATHAFLFTDANGNGLADAGEMADLGTLGGSTSFANLLNEAGQVAGQSKIGGDVADHAFLYTDLNGNGQADSGELLDLGTFGGSSSVAVALNNAGQVAGHAETAGGETHGFLYTDANGNGLIDSGEMLDLGTLGGSSSFVTGMNEAGQVIGYSYTAGDAEIHGFLFTDANGNGQVDSGEMADLGTFGGIQSEAQLINDAGQVAGYATTAAGDSHAFLFTDANGNGQVDPGEVADLGTLGGSSSSVTALNEAGQVAGISDTADNAAQQAFLYTDGNGNGLVDPGEVANLGTLGGNYAFVSALTDTGVVIGMSSDAGDNALFAFIYTADGQMINLNTTIPADTGWLLEQPMMINEAGDIVGYGYLDGVLTPFLMTVNSTTTEPATIADVQEQVSELVSSGALGTRPGAVLQLMLGLARRQLDAGHTRVAILLLNATDNTIDALYYSGRLSAEDYETLVTLLQEVLDSLV